MCHAQFAVMTGDTKHKIKNTIKKKCNPITGGSGSQISRQSAHEGGKVVSPTHQPPLPPREYSWYSFLLEAESTPGPWCGQKDYINENSNPRPSDL